MKRCLQCNRVETDEGLKFCRIDGATLVSDSPWIGLLPDDYNTGYLAMVLGRDGQIAEARKLLEQLKNDSLRRHVTGISLAFAYIGLNQKEEALAMLEKEVSEHGYNSTSFAVMPELDKFRAEPRFKALLKKMDLPEE